VTKERARVIHTQVEARGDVGALKCRNFNAWSTSDVENGLARDQVLKVHWLVTEMQKVLKFDLVPDPGLVAIRPPGVTKHARSDPGLLARRTVYQCADITIVNRAAECPAGLAPVFVIDVHHPARAYGAGQVLGDVGHVVPLPVSGDH
jgi:hypothetical protein